MIKHTLRTKIIQLIEDGAEWFITSGQLGVELWACEIVLELKVSYPEIQLAILTPFFEQESRWPDHVKEKYFMILEQADFVDSITKRPYDNPAQLRMKNDFIVNKTQALLILYDEETPGSPSYFLSSAYRRANAQQDDYKIFTINRFDIELAEQELRESNPDYWSQTD